MAEGVTGRPYGRLPRQLYPYLIPCYEEIKALPIRESPYRVLGRMFGVSHQRIQQVVLDERKRLEKEGAAGGVTGPGGTNASIERSPSTGD